MALIHRAQIVPTKLELIGRWLVDQPWVDVSPGDELVNRGAYRFDDPAGEVGIETILVGAGDGPLLQVPVTYRGAPLEGAEASLMGTMEHTVLGTRWVYDGPGDPAYVAAVTAAVVGGGSESEEWVDQDGTLVARTPTARVWGSGSPRAAEVGPPVVRRLLDGPGRPGPGDLTLSGTWAGQDEPVVLVTVATAPAADPGPRG